MAQPKAEVEVEREETEEPEQNAVTRPEDLGFPRNQQLDRTPEGIPIHREIEVEAIAPQPAPVDQSGMVEIRMAETIEEFTYGNPHRSYRLEANKRYRLPVDVARYLYSLGYTYQIVNR